MADIKWVRFPVPCGVIRGKDGKEERCTHVECSVGYSLGGHNYWCGGVDPRGYYAYVTPVTVGDGCVSSTLGSGGKWLLVQCARRSPKRESEAVSAFNANIRDYIAHLYDSDAVDFAAAS